MATYYRPYLPSDSELSDEEYESDYSETSQASPTASPRPENAGSDVEGPDFAALANALSGPNLAESAGPSLSSEQQIIYGENRLDSRTSYSAYGMTDLSGQALTTTSADTPTVVMLQSRDRDKTIFTQPTNCKLFLPRVYKNITGFSIVQLNLISAFFYFRKDKNNLDIKIEEKGRVVYPADSTKPSTIQETSMKLTNSIREGSYNINELLTELNTQLNRTPLFYDFINGFSDFLYIFSVNGDYSLNFNEPGDNYYDAVRKIYINNPTREIITSFYFQTRYALQYTFTTQQVRNAYYYPVIKEVLLDPNEDLTKYNFNLDTSIINELGLDDLNNIKGVQQYLIYSFSGIDDPVATNIINKNLPHLDRYRLYHTFRYSLVNKYVCTYTPSNNRVNINTPTLNTSLTNMLIAQYNSYLDQQLLLKNLTRDRFNSLSADIIAVSGVVQDMYNYMQSNFAKYFAVDVGTYSREYFTSTMNTLHLRPGLDARGVSLTYTASVENPPLIADRLIDYKQPPPNFWPFMKNLGNTIGPEYNMGDAELSYPTSSNFPYILSSNNMDVDRDFIDQNANIYTDYRRKAGDILVNVEAGKYTIFKFRSLVRQTLQVETLPRQLNYRYPAWNKVNSLIYPADEIFDVSYCFVNPSGILQSKISEIPYKPIYGWSTITGDGRDNVWNYSTNFSATYTASSNFWGSNAEELNSTDANGHYYRFIAPYPTDPVTKGRNVYTYNYSITITSELPFPVDFLAFFYHDVSAFYADMKFKGGRNENPYNYKHKLIIPAGSKSGTYTFKAYAGETYYMIFRSSITSSQSVNFKVIPFCPNGSVYNTLSTSTDFNPLQDPMTMLQNFNVAKNADPAFIRLPVSTIRSIQDPTNVITNLPLDTIATPIGYDINGVSNDLTDYIPFTPFEQFSTILPTAKNRVDPLTDYVFQSNSPYDLTNNSYFTSNTNNFIFTKSALQEYTPQNVLQRQYKIVQYYATNYIKDSGTFSYSSSDISSNVKEYDSITTNGIIRGYKYPNGFLTLGSGVAGFTLLPSDGEWSIDRITFKTNFITASSTNPKITSSDVNAKIHCLGIFITSEINTQPISSANLSNALAICLRVQDKIYNANSQNLGFDSGQGTYHTFNNYSNLVVRKNFKIGGFSQGKGQFITDVNSYYSAIAFTFTDITTWNTSSIDESQISSFIGRGRASVTRIQNMVGTPIPYPFAGTATVSNSFYDGLKTPTGYDVVVSSKIKPNHPYGPPLNLAIDESVSQYAQSIPIVNSHIHYITPQNIIENSNGFSPWDGIQSSVDYIHASVIDNTEYLSTDPTDPHKYKNVYALIQGSAFSLVKYKFYTDSNVNTDADRNFSMIGHITNQHIFPDGENTSLISVSGTPTHFVFLGASNIPGQTYSQLRFKKYDPIQGSLTELPIISEFKFENSYNLQHFVFNSENSWFYTARDNNMIVLNGSLNYSSRETISKEYPSFTQSELQMDPTGLNIYMSIYNNPGFTKLILFSLKNEDTNYINGGNPRTINLDASKVPATLRYYTHFGVTNSEIGEEILLLNNDYDSRSYFKIRSYEPTTTVGTSNTNIDFSIQEFRDKSNNFIAVKRIIGGANGSKWVLSDSPPYILGNRNDEFDCPRALSIAWQIFFPTLKIEMKKLKSGVNPILDLSKLNTPNSSNTTVEYPEWPHTMMFAYSNYASFSNDILADNGKWGLESNYLVSDVGFNGFDFNSYLANIPLQSTISTGTTDNSYYYLAIRGYLPTESFQTMARFYLPNRYDFGFLRLDDMTNEIPIAMSTSTDFNPLYRETLLQFNSTFIFTEKNFGQNYRQGVVGSNLASIGFEDFLSQYKVYHDMFIEQTNNLNSINSNVKEAMNRFIITNLSYILPATALNRQRFIDPIVSRILWKENLDPIHLELDDEWGLGWNLGFAKKDTVFSTSHSAESFYKINQDYIYLRLNPEFSINGMDAGGKENYKVSREPSGTTKQYYCKLLLTNFGGNATTFIHNPIKFNPPINRITNLQFQWIDSKGVIIDNSDCEWDMTVNITESSETSQIPSKMNFQIADPKIKAPINL